MVDIFSPMTHINTSYWYHGFPTIGNSLIWLRKQLFACT